MQVPTALSAIDAAWMSEALTGAGHHVEVTGLDYQPMSGIVGTLGEVGIFSLDYAGETDLPAQMLGKCPLDHETARLYNGLMRYYERETGFYRDLADKVPMRVPRCFVNLSEGEHHILLLEYFATAERGDLLAGTGFDLLKRLVGDMAELHGRFWLDEEARALPWQFTWDEPALPLGWAVAKDTWPQAVERFGGVPEDLDALVRGPYLEEIPVEAWAQAYASRPWTIIHGDYELDNMLFCDDSGDQTVIVDWQGTMPCFPGMDLALTLAATPLPEGVERERELLDHYRERLSASGGPSWLHEDLMEDLAWAGLWFATGQSIPALQDYSDMGAQGERMERRMAAMFRGCVDAAVRWGTAQRVQPPA